MLGWIAARSIPIIGLIVFTWCYMMAAAVYAAVRWAARRGCAPTFKAISPVTLTPLAVVFGLFVGFLAVDVWPNFERARAAVAQEAMSLRQAVILADALPPADGAVVKTAIRQHIAHVVMQEWPAMAAKTEDLWGSPDALEKIVTGLLGKQETQIGAQRLEDQIAAALQRVLDAGRQRILISHMSVGAIKWFVLMVLAGLIEVTIAMIHVDARRTQAIALVVFATAVAVSTLLITAYDRPFAGGGISVTPAAIQGVLPP
jgi:hypothetical protein